VKNEGICQFLDTERTPANIMIRRALSGIVRNETDEVLRMITSLLIRELLFHGTPVEDFSHQSGDEDLFMEFPYSQLRESQWLYQVQDFLGRVDNYMPREHRSVHSLVRTNCPGTNKFEICQILPETDPGRRDARRICSCR